MPSRKIISILIITSALVVGIMLASSRKEGGNSRTGVTTLKTPEIKISAQSTGEWKRDLGVLPASDQAATSTFETLTDQVSQSLAANYLAMKQGGTLDSNSAQTLINQASEAALKPTPDKYSSGNIIISQDNSQKMITLYGAALGTSMKMNLPQTPRNEMAIFSNILRSKDESGASQLKDIATTYKNIAADMSKITVPSTYTSMHLAMINSLYKIGLAVDDMALVFKDPIKSLQSIYIYQENYTRYLTATVEIKTKLLNDKVVYKQGESGYYFYFGI